MKAKYSVGEQIITRTGTTGKVVEVFDSLTGAQEHAYKVEFSPYAYGYMSEADLDVPHVPKVRCTCGLTSLGKSGEGGNHSHYCDLVQS